MVFFYTKVRSAPWFNGYNKSLLRIRWQFDSAWDQSSKANDFSLSLFYLNAKSVFSLLNFAEILLGLRVVADGNK